MNLKEASKEINEILEKRKQELELTFVEEKHIYFMKDLSGKIRSDFPSVSKVIKKFHSPFDAPKKALEMSKGDVTAQQKLLAEWKLSGEISTNMGSRVHYYLEEELINRYGAYKEIRQPIFKCDEKQITKSEEMIKAGKQYLDLMHERGAVLIDTEIVLGDNELGYTGQPDKTWLMETKEKDNFGIVITDWKTNQPKNFEIEWYTGKMYPPFDAFPNNALGHYYIQIPLYGRLLLKMLQGSKYEGIKLLGGVVVLLKDDGSYIEYKVPAEINSKILTMNLNNYVK